MTKPITYGSVCSGIEAASCAWDSLGWKPEWFAEIEPFPSAVLNHHFPDVPNLGDMTKIADKIISGEVAAPDVLVGGTPCQAFSVAGLRKGLSDDRGILTLKYVELADAIDTQRAREGKEPAFIVWENVPGVLSNSDNPFGHFLAGISGADEALEPGNRPEHGKANAHWRWDAKTSSHIPKWTNAGCVIGTKRKVAWRILDAQYIGVAQRRRRIFVVASASEKFDPFKVLLEFDGLRRDIAPSRNSQEITASLTANGVGTCGADDNQAQARHLVPCSRAFRMVAFGEYVEDGTASTCKARDYKDATDLAVHGTQDPDISIGVAHTIGRNQGQENAVLSFYSKGAGNDVSVDISPSIRAGNSSNSNQNAGSPPAVAYGIPGNWIGRKPENGGNSVEPMHDVSPCLTTTDKHGVAYAFAENTRCEVRFYNGDGSISPCLSTGGGKPGQGNPCVLVKENSPCSQCANYMAFQQNASGELREGVVAGTLNTNSNPSGRNTPMVYQSQTLAVRRLLPVECERLQGFPDNWTLIPWKGKPAEECPDGQRYKAIGNSMAVPVMHWIGQRIDQQIGAQQSPVMVSEPPKKSIKNTGIEKKHAFAKPFLKWVGGKFLQLPEILPLLEGHQRLIEPFAGGGSIFLNAGFKTALINDNCSDLINTYQQLQENAHDIITRAFRLFQLYNGQAPYLRIREKFNAGKYTPAERAAVFIYLNRHCFNGLIRYNAKGEFNVGYGKYEAPYFPLEEMENFIGCSEGMTFSCEDYSAVIEQAGAGDVVFCDPPYEPLPDKEGFTQYSNGTTFKMDDQARLIKCALEAHQRGATIIITNSGAESIKELYRANGFDIREVSVKRGMSSKSGDKPRAKDIIAVKKSLMPF
ncbi:Dam family site-specific DNA-(adenine-N6)-methyltransferase [Rosenbergiella collisarenosi]|uniref:Dam family site-specific DNA-(adenine-N6)-methyltransferase n=1 Tax=Rosenbergiella collisarenosi TaxID=1544695 RepID=UPI001F4DF7B5|nr:Dam family site-specific DNA-(adenine-N6)-methyltransferase [Rosenbergiella collisarenosi]